MNALYVGTKPHIELPRGGCLLIDDEVPLTDRARYFDPRIHSFNPLRGLDYKKACDLVEVFDALFSRGDSTLTKDTGLDFIADALDRKPGRLDALIEEPDKQSSTGHIWAYLKVRRLMRSPVLRRMLCSPTNFSFNPRSTILARVNRAELGDFDALAIGLFLIAHFPGQVVLPDLGFYGRDVHVALIRQNRLLGAVRYLDELPERLRNQAIQIEDMRPAGALYDDAVLLAKRDGLVPGTNKYNDAVAEAMAVPYPKPEPEMWKPPEVPEKAVERPEKPKRRIVRVPRTSDPY